MLRNDNGKVTKEFKEELSKELGDVLGYLTRTAAEFGLDLEKIALSNIEKVLSRQKRGVLHSKGDNR